MRYAKDSHNYVVSIKSGNLQNTFLHIKGGRLVRSINLRKTSNFHVSLIYFNYAGC